jgi:hypothetical protein
LKKGDNHILTQAKKIILVFGILVGFYAMNTEVMTGSIHKDAVEEGATNQDQPSDAQVIKAFDAITYSSQINVHHAAILIEELQGTVVEMELVLKEKVGASNAYKALKILFQLIISPNAP